MVKVAIVVVLSLVTVLSGGAEERSPYQKFRIARSRSPVELTDRTFGVVTGNDFWVINFYAPWCEHCVQLEPEWIKFAKELDRDLGINIGEVNCVEQQRLVSTFAIRRHPTILMYHDRKVWTYTGGQTASDLVSYFRQYSPDSWHSNPLTIMIPEDSPVLELRTPTEKEIRTMARPKELDVALPEELELAKVALPVRLSLHSFPQSVKQGSWFVKVCSTFTSECQSIIPKWIDAMSRVKAAFGNEIRFGEIEATDDFSHQYRIEKIPSFLVFHNGQMFRYNRKLENIVSYFQKDLSDDTPTVIRSLEPHSKNWTRSELAIRLIMIAAGIVIIARIVNALISWSNKSKSV